jgi:hypothetical protein
LFLNYLQLFPFSNNSAGVSQHRDLFAKEVHVLGQLLLIEVGVPQITHHHIVHHRVLVVVYQLLLKKKVRYDLERLHQLDAMFYQTIPT